MAEWSELGWGIVTRSRYLSHEILNTKARNEVVIWANRSLPMFEGWTYEIKSKSLGGGLWEVWAQKKEYK